MPNSITRTPRDDTIDNTDRAILVTDAPRSYQAEFNERRRRYSLIMSMRIPCLILATLLYQVSPWLAGAIIMLSVPLPWIAVLIANDRLPRKPSTFHAHRRSRTGLVPPDSAITPPRPTAAASTITLAPVPLSLCLAPEDDAITLHVAGEIDMSNIGQFDTALRNLLDRAPTPIARRVEAAGITHLSARGMRTLGAAALTAQEQHIPFEVHGCSPRLLGIIRIADLGPALHAAIVAGEGEQPGSSRHPLIAAQDDPERSLPADRSQS